MGRGILITIIVIAIIAVVAYWYQSTHRILIIPHVIVTPSPTNSSSGNISPTVPPTTTVAPLTPSTSPTYETQTPVPSMSVTPTGSY